jgi:hypothetical protein
MQAEAQPVQRPWGRMEREEQRERGQGGICPTKAFISRGGNLKTPTLVANPMRTPSCLEDGGGRGRRERKGERAVFACPCTNKLRCTCQSVREASRRETIKSHSCSEGP